MTVRHKTQAQTQASSTQAQARQHAGSTGSTGSTQAPGLPMHCGPRRGSPISSTVWCGPAGDGPRHSEAAARSGQMEDLWPQGDLWLHHRILSFLRRKQPAVASSHHCLLYLCLFTVHRHCLPLTFHFLSWTFLLLLDLSLPVLDPPAFPWPSTAFPLTFSLPTGGRTQPTRRRRQRLATTPDRCIETLHFLLKKRFILAEHLRKHGRFHRLSLVCSPPPHCVCLHRQATCAWPRAGSCSATRCTPA